MSDEYIKRNDAIALIAQLPAWHGSEGAWICQKDVLDILKTIPADAAHIADVTEVKHGRWISAYPQKEQNPMFNYGTCSICGFKQSISNKLNFCPNCGAKMDKEEDHD